MEEQSTERIDPIAQFPPEMQQDAQSLAYLGHLSDTVDFCGHTFGIETIRPYLKFTIGQALEPYRNTLMEPQAFAAMHMGVALTSVDHDPNFCPPVGDNEREFVEARFRWLTTQTGWWQPTIDYLFAEYLRLEAEAGVTVAELHRLSTRGRDTSQPSPDSLTDSGFSSDKTTSDTQPSESSS